MYYHKFLFLSKGETYVSLWAYNIVYFFITEVWCEVH